MRRTSTRRQSSCSVRTSGPTAWTESRRMKAMPAESWTRSHRSTASSWTSRIRRSTTSRTPSRRSGRGGSSTSIGSWSGRTSRPRWTESEPSPQRPGSKSPLCEPTRSAHTRQRNTTSHSTSRSFERHAALSLIRSGALLVRLRRRGLQREEDNLREPLADRQLEDVGAAIQRAEGEGPGEAGIEHAEGRQDPPAGPGRPKPELARDVPAETDGLASANREPSRRRDPCNPLSRSRVRGWDEDLLDRDVITVRREVPLVERLDPQLPFRHIPTNVSVRKEGHPVEYPSVSH